MNPRVEMRIILTGANGQLGRSIRSLAVAHPDIEFVYTDVEELDITEEGSLQLFAQSLEVNLPTVLVNCAAYTAVDRAESEPDIAEQLNHIAVQNLANACLDLGYLMIQVSTDYVFDGTNSRPYTEEAPKLPLGVYGATKSKGEDAVVSILGKRGLVMRTSWLYSPFGRNFVLSMLSLASTREYIGVVSDQVGAPTYAPHLAEAIVQIAIEASQVGHFTCPIVHYTNSGVCSWYDLAYYAIERVLGRGRVVAPIRTDEYPTAAIRPAYSVLGKDRLRQHYGIVPPHWTEGIVCLSQEIDIEQYKI